MDAAGHQLQGIRRVSPARVLLVTGGLAVGGAVAGAAVAVIVLLVTSTAVRALRPTTVEPFAWFVTALVGSVCGAVLGPLIAWIFLRSVPLGRAILHTSIGAAIGGSLAFALPRAGIIIIPLLATLGAILAAVRLRWKYRAG